MLHAWDKPKSPDSKTIFIWNLWINIVIYKNVKYIKLEILAVAAVWWGNWNYKRKWKNLGGDETVKFSWKISHRI